MQGKVYEIPLDISNGVLTSQIRTLVTEDMGTNTFKFKVVSDNHKPYDFTGTIVRMIAKTPSGARIQQECIIENAVGGVLRITLKQSLLLEHGSYIAELQIFDAITQSIRLTTPTFPYHVRQSLQNSESIVATDEYTILQQALADLAGINIVVANKADKSDVGVLDDLGTDEKANLVAAINEVKLQSNEMATEITNHKGEVISQIIAVNRDATLVGSQIVSGFVGKPKQIDIMCIVTGTKKASWGTVTPNAQRVVGIAGDGNTLHIGNASILIANDAVGNHTFGTITINEDNTITVNWAKNGTGGTGTSVVVFTAYYHGEG